MDPQKYNEIINYLQNNTIPTTNLPQTGNPTKSFINFCNGFQIQNNYLYKKDKRRNGNLLRVIRRFEMNPLLYMMHNDSTSGHFAAENMFNKIRDRYYWPQMFEDIRNYAKSCDACQRRGKSKKTQRLHPIPVHGPFFQIGIDFVGPLPITEKGNRYIIVAMDYLTKWPEARPVPQATAEATASFLYEDIICRHGCPSRILTDRGTHFNNQLVNSLMDRFSVKHLLSSPYHPQTNGLVERFNRTLCEALAKLVNHSNEWDRYISPVLFAYRTSKQATTQVTPFYLTYGREARLPVDDLSDDFVTIQQRIMGLIDELPLLRESVKETITEKQGEQKRRYDLRIPQEITFTIGDKVLYYKAALDNQRSGKLDKKWKGPYYVHDTGLNGAYKLRDMQGKISKACINGNLLKIYKERDN